MFNIDDYDIDELKSNFSPQRICEFKSAVLDAIMHNMVSTVEDDVINVEVGGVEDLIDCLRKIEKRELAIELLGSSRKMMIGLMISAVENRELKEVFSGIDEVIVLDCPCCNFSVEN